MAVQEQLSKVQKLLQVEQQSRQEEQLHQADMLKELQGLISSERTAKMALAEKLKEKENKLAQQQMEAAVEK